MNKKVILWSAVASIFSASLVAHTISTINNRPTVENSATTITEPVADLHFTSFTQSESLPELTSAAQKGVDAVVYVETMARGRSSRGSSIDPLEFFFGPNYREQGSQPKSDELQKLGGGSGVLISSDGYIVTNNHVINGAEMVNITLNSGDTFPAEVIGSDPSTDIALLKIESSAPLSYLTFGDSERLKVGEWVLAVGNPFGLNSTVTAGIVSAKGRSLGASQGTTMGIESFIQTDAAVNPGNSGGALITTDGALVGINTLIKSPTGSFTGYSFAVPSTIARKIVSDIREYGVVQRALLGIAMQEITAEWITQQGAKYSISEREGVFVAGVSEGGAAESVGVKVGDVLIEINGKEVSTPSEVQELITAYRPGDKVNISIKRGGKVKHFDVTLRNSSGREELLSATEVDLVKRLGATLTTPSESILDKLNLRGGLQVTALQSDGILAKSKVKVGFIITSINDEPVRSQSDLKKITGDITSITGIYPSGQIVEYRTL